MSQVRTGAKGFPLDVTRSKARLDRDAPELQHGDMEKPPTNPVQPWARRKGESMRAYELFVTFLTLGKDRSYRRVSEVHGCQVSTIANHAKKWAWQVRAAAYEEYYVLISVQSLEETKQNALQEQRSLAQKAYLMLHTHFDKIISQIDEYGYADVIKPDVLVKLFSETAKVDRQAILDMMSMSAWTKEEIDRMAERWANEMTEFVRELVSELELSQEQQIAAGEILKRRMLNGVPD